MGKLKANAVPLLLGAVIGYFGVPMLLNLVKR